MALVWKEQFFERRVSETSSGANPTRGWTVTGGGPDVVRNNPLAPHRGDTHPDDSNLIVNTVSYTPTGYGTLVRAQYLPAEFIDSPPPEDTTGIEWTKIDSTFEDVDVNIPVFEIVTKSHPGPGGTVIENDYWQPVERTTPFRYTRLVHRITVNAIVPSAGDVSTQLSLAVPISNQHNKIHTIGGLKYLFMADGIRRIKADQYQFTYRWIFDPGVPNTIDMQTGDHANIGIIGSYGFPYADDLYIVPPYSRIDTAPDGNDPTNSPVVKVSPAYLEDPNGWLTLPGMV